MVVVAYPARAYHMSDIRSGIIVFKARSHLRPPRSSFDGNNPSSSRPRRRRVLALSADCEYPQTCSTVGASSQSHVAIPIPVRLSLVSDVEAEPNDRKQRTRHIKRTVAVCCRSSLHPSSFLHRPFPLLPPNHPFIHQRHVTTYLESIAKATRPNRSCFFKG
jgi:hypothetical protein